MEQHLRIGSGNQPDLRLFYFRTNGMNKCVKVRFSYMMFSVIFHSNVYCCRKYNSNSG